MRSSLINRKINKKNYFLLTLLWFALHQSAVAQEYQQEPLAFGFFPYMNGSGIVKLYQPLADFLGKNLNRKVIIVSAPSSEEFITRSDNQQYDIIFTAPHFALRAERQKNYKRLVRFDNELKAVLFVAGKSQVNSVFELKAKKIAFPDKLMVVTALAQVHFQNRAVELESVYLPSHNNVIISVLNSQVAAGIVAGPIFAEYVKTNPGSLRRIEDTESVPSSMFMLKSDLTDTEKLGIQQAFMLFESSDEGRNFFTQSPFKGFKPISDQELNSMHRYLEIVENRL